MKTIKILGTLLFAMLLFSCKKEVKNPQTEVDYLVFGHFYGFCIGSETCIEIFKLNDEQLFEDSKDQLPDRTNFYDGNYLALDQSKFEQVKDLMGYFPENLLNETDTVFGCPDCADQGGFYIEYKSDSTHKFWIFDKAIESNPAFTHDFLNKVNDKIQLMNQ